MMVMDLMDLMDHFVGVNNGDVYDEQAAVASITFLQNVEKVQ